MPEFPFANNAEGTFRIEQRYLGKKGKTLIQNNE